MQMAEASLINGSGPRSSPYDANLRLRFHMHPVKDEVASLKEGRDIFRDEEYLQIIVPGDKDNITDGPVHDLIKKRFAPQYAAWKASGNGEASNGTPLEAWAGISRSQVEEMKFFKVNTIEDLANMSDSNCQKFVGIQLLRQRARDFVAAAKGEAPLLEVRSQLAERDNKIESLQHALEEQGKQIKALMKQSKG